jgi:hypothetical protein
MKAHRFSFVSAVVLCVAFVFISLVSAQTPIEELIITNVDASEFPQVHVHIRPLDRLGVPVSNLTLERLDVEEDGEEMALESIQEVETGLWIHFIVDAGAGLTEGPRWESVQEGILNFVQTTPWMKENTDHIAVTVIEAGGARELIDFTSDPNSVASVLEGYTPPGGTNYSDPLSGIETTLEEMNLLQQAQKQPKFIVFFTPGLETGTTDRAENIAEQASELGIPIYTGLVRAIPRLSGEEGSDQKVVLLGEESGGSYTHATEANSMNGVYEAIVEHRRLYEISYRTSSNNSGTHQIQIATGAEGPGTVSDQASYDVEVAPPRVIIETPEDGDVIERKADEYIADRSTLNPTTQTIVARVIFPDDHLRRLSQATLLVNGKVEATKENPGSDFELSWNLRPIQSQGMNDFTLEVEVEDELGLASTSPPVSTRVDVFVPPKPEGIDAVDVDQLRDDIQREVEENMVVPPIQCFDFTPERICDLVERPVRRNWIAFLSIMISLSFAGVVWVNRDRAPVQAARQTVMGAVERLTSRYQRSEPIAYLEVLEGDRNIGKPLEIYGDTPVGRSKQVSELLFQPYDESSPISRLHCTILNEEDHFLIKDEDSANGTYLNGVRLEPLVEEDLEDGDEIELARVERGGVRLRFQIAEAELGEGLRETRQTRGSSAPDDYSETSVKGDRF